MTINELLDIRWFIHYVYQTCQNYQIINWNRLDLNDYYVNFYYHSGRVDSKLFLFFSNKRTIRILWQLTNQDQILMITTIIITNIGFLFAQRIARTIPIDSGTGFP